MTQSIITQLIESENTTETIKNLWETIDIQAIPALIYLALTDDEEVKNATCSVLYKISCASSEAQTPTSSPIITYPIDKSSDNSQKRTIVKVPKTPTVTSKSITFAFHIFSAQCHTFPQQILDDTLDLLPHFFEIKDFVISSRILLDILTILPLFFNGDKKDQAYSLLNTVKENAEERSIVEVIVAANSLLVLYPNN